MNFKGGFWNVQNVQNGVQVVSQFLDDIPKKYPHGILIASLFWWSKMVEFICKNSHPTDG